jgi:hypothetical protein
MFCSCSPQSKESYLTRYDAFINEVGKNRQLYTDAEWETKNREFEQFANEWYEKFKDDFTWKEELKLAANKVKYNYYRFTKESSNFLKDLFDDPDIKELRTQIKFYVDNQMDDDIAKLVEEAKKAGKEAEAIVTEILNDLKVTVKNRNDN